MLKKKVWIPLIVLIGLTGGFLFYQHQTAELEPIKIYPTDIDTGETSQTSQPPKAVTAPHGHYHEDGTFHAEPHAPVEPPGKAPVVEAPVETPTLPKTPETLAKENRRSAIMLEHVPKLLELDKKNRDIVKRSYEKRLRFLKLSEEQEYPSHLIEKAKEDVAAAKAELDRYEGYVSQSEKWRDELEKWRDENVKK